MKKFAFHDVARSERYFTATLLSHLLMANNFEGLKILFNHLEIKPIDTTNKEFEIVTELDPLRDGGAVNTFIKDTFRQEGRVAVPDIFLRWGEQILVIEAKFFSLPIEEALEAQLNEQKRAISLVVDKTVYESTKITYSLLLIDKTGVTNTSDAKLMTWDDVINLFNPVLSSLSDDCKYSLKVIEQSIIRAKDELLKTSKTKVTWIEIKTIEELIKGLSDNIDNGYRYVGFSEGLDNPILTPDFFEKRSCYRISKIKWTHNWYEVEKVISKYISLKYWEK